MKTILVTGSAGFIGANLVKRLFKELKEDTIVGLDNLNAYYDVSLKEYRLQQLSTLHSQLASNSKSSTLNYEFVKGSIADKALVPMQPGDVPTTYADATALEHDFGFTPKITLREGLRKFAEWYKDYYTK